MRRLLASMIVVTWLGSAAARAEPDPAIATLRTMASSQIDVLERQTVALYGQQKPDAVAIDALFTPDSQIATMGTAGDATSAQVKTARTLFVDWLDVPGTHTESNVSVTRSADGKSAWVSFVSNIHVRGTGAQREIVYRVSEVAVMTDAGWRFAAGMFSQPRGNDEVNKLAQAQHLTLRPVWPPNTPPGDTGLLTAFLAWQDHPIDAAAAANKSLVVFGSGPGERTVGGAGFARAWTASWMNHVPLGSPAVATLAPSHTTGWVITDIMLEKHAKAGQTYLIPFRVFAVFDRLPTDAWTLEHVHLAVPPAAL